MEYKLGVKNLMKINSDHPHNTPCSPSIGCDTARKVKQGYLGERQSTKPRLKLIYNILFKSYLVQGFVLILGLFSLLREANFNR